MSGKVLIELPVDPALLEEARKKGLSTFARSASGGARRNREAIESMNQFVRRHGLLHERLAVSGRRYRLFVKPRKRKTTGSP